MNTKIDTFKRLYKDYTNKYLNKIIIAFLFSLSVAGCTSAIAYLLDPAIKKIFIDKDQSLMFVIPLVIVITFSVKGFSLYVSKVLMINVAYEVKNAVQKDMLKALIASDTKFIDKSHSGKFISNLTNDVNLLTNLISVAVLNLFKDTFTLIGLLAVMFFQNWKLSLIAIIMIPIAGFVARHLGKRINKVSEEMLQKAGLFTTRLIEIFKNHKLIKIFQAENLENLKTKKSLEEFKEKQIKTMVVFNRNTPIMETLTGIMIAALLVYSAALIQRNELEINNFFSFLAAMMLAYQPVRALSGLNIAINQGLTAANRVLPIIDLENEINDNINLPDLNILNGNIEFQNINFKYDLDEKKSALNSINLRIDGGKTTALVGSSGAGKSTILNLIPRFYNQQSGELKIDNQSTKEINLHSLRKNISYVSQETTLFDDTIKNNIMYANPSATYDDLVDVSKKSFAADFIEKLPQKYETIIGENGLRLSGGEKQRLSIARAMLKKSKIILLDEATSSLDSATEEKIQHAISELTKDKTAVIIAHRLSTIINADTIYVIDKGKVLESGDHKYLLEKSEKYKNFYLKQMQKT